MKPFVFDSAVVDPEDIARHVVGPGLESCSAGKNGKVAIVVNNSD